MTTTNKIKKCVNRPTPHPNEKTRWAYYMQAIEPRCEKINSAWPEYHPLWVQQSQKLIPGAEQFKYMRQYMLDINHEQCAAYLRVSERQIKLWELNKSPVPFMAFELLRLVHESVHFRLSHNDWAGWFIASNGQLVCPDVGNTYFKPEDLSIIWLDKQRLRNYENTIREMTEKLEPLKRQNKMLADLVGISEFADVEHDLEKALKSLESLRGKITKVKNKFWQKETVSW